MIDGTHVSTNRKNYIIAYIVVTSLRRVYIFGIFALSNNYIVENSIIYWSYQNSCLKPKLKYVK